VPGTYVYIDGFNFYHGILKDSPYKWLDFEALAHALVPQDHIGKIRYFTANIKPCGPGDTGPTRQNAYLRALDSNPLVEIIRGKYQNKIEWRGLAEFEHTPRDLFRPHLRPGMLIGGLLAEARRRRTGHHTLARVNLREEKGTDVSLGAYLVFDALKNNCSKALVLSNDSDLKDAVKLAASDGMSVGIVNPHVKQPTSKTLLREADFEIVLRRATLATCQLPITVTCPNGKEVHKPREW
jgi:uncharacterized LabA/DUF88 family protein